MRMSTIVVRLDVLVWRRRRSLVWVASTSYVSLRTTVTTTNCSWQNYPRVNRTFARICISCAVAMVWHARRTFAGLAPKTVSSGYRFVVGLLHPRKYAPSPPFFCWKTDLSPNYFSSRRLVDDHPRAHQTSFHQKKGGDGAYFRGWSCFVSKWADIRGYLPVTGIPTGNWDTHRQSVRVVEEERLHLERRRRNGCHTG